MVGHPREAGKWHKFKSFYLGFRLDSKNLSDSTIGKARRIRFYVKKAS
jgi:hypothetical protein